MECWNSNFAAPRLSTPLQAVLDGFLANNKVGHPKFGSGRGDNKVGVAVDLSWDSEVTPDATIRLGFVAGF